MIWPVLDALIAFGLTFGVSRYGPGAVFVMLPWLLRRSTKRTWPWGAFAVAALALGIAIATGLLGLGDFAHALGPQRFKA
jgi:ABC-type nickel/cobalt efflux system permease component RcnA